MRAVFAIHEARRARSDAPYLEVLGQGVASPFHGAALHLQSEAEEAASGIVEPGEFHFHHEGILGTSFDLIVRADRRTAAAQAAQVALAEIERLRRILSAYDPASEVSRLNAADGPMSCSPELFEVLSAYDSWTTRSGGAHNGQLGELIQTWRAAEKSGAPPGEAALARIVRSLSMPGWTMNAGDRTVTRLTTHRLNVDSLGKGYIISRAAAAARAAVPALSGFLLNIGGDIFACGQGAPDRPWRIGVADPKAAADNAPPLTQVLLADRAISTSAAYERGFTVAGRRYSHILDPRTGFPAEGAASATVVAADNATANALATTLCVLEPEEGLALVKGLPVPNA